MIAQIGQGVDRARFFIRAWTAEARDGAVAPSDSDADMVAILPKPSRKPAPSQNPLV
jgi:hypothetical protein